MVEDTKKSVFLSYAHEDRGLASKLAHALTAQGVDVWWDEWEILAGDSLIQKIFHQGLAKCDVFLLLLSNSSVNSKWVREELDTAMIRKIEGSTRVVPLLAEKCEVPVPLRPLLWIDLSSDFDKGLRELVKSIYGVSEKPAPGKTPEYISTLKTSVPGLSQIASAIGYMMLKVDSQEPTEGRSYSPTEIEECFPSLKVNEIDDAIDELEEDGLIVSRRYMGNEPHSFSDAEPTYQLFIKFKQYLKYDPEEDIKVIAAAVTRNESMENQALSSETGIPVTRLNRAVEYLEDYGLVKVHKYMGSFPYTFNVVEATRKTRDFVRENAK